MNQIETHLKDIAEIRDMMERSSKFLSLSGLSGITIGVIALIGDWVVYEFIQPFRKYPGSIGGVGWIMAAISGLVLILSLALAVLFTVRMAKRKGLPVWNKTSKYMLISLFTPLVIGGLFCLALIQNEYLELLAPVTLMIYGISLLSASKYTVKEIQFLAYCEALLGILAAFYPMWGLVFWGIGFGVLHIVYGTYIYLKYEK